MRTLRRALAAAATVLALGVPTAAAAAAQPVEMSRDVEVGEQQLVERAESLFGSLTIVPGFDRTRSVVFRNDGRLPGELVVSVVEARLHHEPRDGFFDELTVNGVSASRLEGRDTDIQRTALAPGESVEVPVRLAFHGSSGNAAEVGEQTFSFALRAVLSGDTPGQQAAPPGVSGPVTQTGGVAREAGPWLLLAAAALALALALADRRRRDTAG